MSTSRFTGADPWVEPPPQGARRGQHRRASQALADYRALLAVSEFRALSAAQLLTCLGEQLAQVTVAVMVYSRTGSPLLTALAWALAYLPAIPGRALLACLADVVPRRRLMTLIDLLRGGLLLLMALPGLSLAWVCTLLFAMALLGPPHGAARAALLADVLSPGSLPLGAAVSNITFQSSQAAGFALGAVLAGWFGPSIALAAGAVPFTLSAGLVASGVAERRLPPPPQRPQPFRLALCQGAAVVFRRPELRTLLLFGWLAGFAVVPEGLAAPYARTLGGGPFTVGLLMSAMPAGMIAGAALIQRLAGPLARLRMISWLAVLSCAPLTASLVRPPLWLLLPLWALAGAGTAYQLAAASAFVRALPGESRKQAFALAQSGLLAAQGAAVLVAGAAAVRAGPEPVVAFAGLAGMSMAVLLATSWARHRGEIATDPADAPDALN